MVSYESEVLAAKKRAWTRFGFQLSTDQSSLLSKIIIKTRRIVICWYVVSTSILGKILKYPSFPTNHTSGSAVILRKLAVFLSGTFRGRMFWETCIFQHLSNSDNIKDRNYYNFCIYSQNFFLTTLFQKFCKNKNQQVIYNNYHKQKYNFNNYIRIVYFCFYINCNLLFFELFIVALLVYSPMFAINLK